MSEYNLNDVIDILWEKILDAKDKENIIVKKDHLRFILEKMNEVKSISDN